MISSFPRKKLVHLFGNRIKDIIILQNKEEILTIARIQQNQRD